MGWPLCVFYIKVLIVYYLFSLVIYRLPDIEELHEAAIEILFGLSFLSFAGEGDLPVFDVSQGAFHQVDGNKFFLNLGISRKEYYYIPFVVEFVDIRFSKGENLLES